MKQTITLFILVAFVILSGCRVNDKDTPQMDQSNERPDNDAKEVLAEMADTNDKKAAEATMHNASGEAIGTVTFYQKDKSVLVEALFEKGLSPGWHGFHIHEKGLCDPYDPEGAFLSAGGHYNPEKTSHPNHAGDMPLLYAHEDGSAYMLTSLDRFDAKQLAQENRGIIVHANADNYANIPERYQSGDTKGPDEETLKAGDAGSRVACGVIKTNVN